MSTVCVHAVNLDGCPAESVCRQHLDADEIRRLERLHTPLLRHRFAARRWALRQLLAAVRGVASTAITYVLSPEGRPRFRDGRGPHFSTAHREQIAVIAWCTDDVGIDVEIVPLSRERAALPVLATEELEWLAVHADVYAFLALWTAKEAYLKARGVGLGEDARLSAVIPTPSGATLVRPADGDASWAFTRFSPASGIATCCHRPGSSVEIATATMTRSLLLPPMGTR